MQKGSVVQTVENLIQPVLKDLGLELVDIEYRREGQGWVLRIFIDREDGGVTLEDCSRVSHQTGDLIEIDDLITNPYRLEVSSPGLDRPLKKEQDFLKHKNRRIRLNTFAPIEKRRNFKGTIQDFREGILYLEAESGPFEIPLDNIAKANLEIEILKKMNLEILNIIDLLCREKGIEREVLIDALKTAVEAAARKKLPHIETLQGRFNEETGGMEILTEKTVVTTVEDPEQEISLTDAVELVPTAELGEKVLAPLELENMGRIAAQLAKQVILQRVRDAEIEIVFNEYKNKKGDIINGIVQRMEHGDIIIDLGKAEGILPRREQVFRESFNRGERIRAFVLDVRKTSKNALVILSRTHVGLIKRLFELEVPEIGEGMVEIMGIVREPNGRTKIAVRSTDREIDAVGACVGMRGMRVQSIVQELRGEKIDIVEYSEDAETFIRNALSPAKISRIIMDRENRSMTIIVADDQMSLAIGKKGQNVRLAAKLVKWKIDIKGESESVGLDFAQAFLSKKPAENRVDFLEILKDAKGFGEKIVSLLFAQNVVSLEQVLEMGVQGLTQLPGIGPKKAEAIYEFAVANKPAEEDEVVKEPEAAKQIEQDDSLVYTSPSITSSGSSLFDSAMAAATKEMEASKAAEAASGAGDEGEVESPVEPAEDESPSLSEEEEGEDEEEQDPPVEALEGIAPETVQLLAANGFQTIPELSVTPIEELLAIEGLDEDAARKLLAQAQTYMENFENA